MSRIRRLLPALALLAAAAAGAADVDFKGIRIGHPFATPTPAGAPTAAVYLSLENRTRSGDRLLSASTPRAKRVELHTMSMAGDVMRMREVDALEIKPGEKLDMRPGSGFHVMLVDLDAPLKAGDKFAMTLRFEKSGPAKIEVSVEQPQAAGPGHRH
jgi:copper(I)-binding protein